MSLLEATLAAMGWVVSNHLNGNVEPRPMGNENFTAAPSGTFATGGGPLNIAANEQKQYETLCDLVGRPDLKSDSRFADRQSRKLNRAALSVELNAALAGALRRRVGRAVQRQRRAGRQRARSPRDPAGRAGRGPAVRGDADATVTGGSRCG